ncbi:AAA family ATPase [Streptomyces olivaceus]|uniref:AAA family ATPase n=1 Tax=Streptomyces olivaceus TaxID=47716 RepID=UPI001CCB9D49|nr:LuxR family transcriptional regulator [Streptomyces olivaceus]MBZ6142431.1 AAA family ATPase [Streptomyces olivaceus]MBZ6170083.1 AAA family ATPase [Streptomyces olivaceus]MBZ6260436.1 AAA family ATPase [Streptomyces olivaceus]
MLLERETELALAAACLRRAAAGHGSLLLVEGPLGAGRSSFLEALPQQASGERITVLRAQASRSEQWLAFGVVDQLLESAACVAATAGSGKARRACDDAHRGPVGDRVPLSAVLDGVPGDGAVLVLVDDLQWCDTESLAELSKGLAGRHGRRVVSALSLPSGVVPAAGSALGALVGAADRRIRLGALGPEGVRRSVEAALGGAEADFVAAVRTRSAGNPLLLRSLLDEAYSRGLRPRAQDAEVVRTLRSEILCQYLSAFLRSQPGPVRRTVHALCVLGGDADQRVAALLADLDAAGYAEAVGTLHRWGLGRPGDEEHGTLLWDALADGVPADELTVMRNRAAVLLHRTGHSVEAAAGQLMSVHTLRAPGAVRILRAAADRALARGAPRDAARYLRQALLDGSCTGLLRARVLTDLAVAERQFATVAALRHVVEALPLFDSALDRAAAAVQLGPLLYQPSESGIAALTGDLAAQLRTRGGDDAAAAELALRLEARHYALGAQDPAVLPAALRRLDELGPRPPAGTVGERELLAALIHVAFVTNNASAERVADLGAPLMALEPPDPRHAHTPLPLAVNALAAAEHTAETVRWLDAVGRRVGHRDTDAETAVLRAERAMVALSHGRIAEARRAVVPTGTAEEAQARASALCTAVQAIVTLHSDEPELAERLLTGNLSHHQDQYHAALLHMTRGLLAARRRHDLIALHHFRTAGERLERIGWSNPAVLPWSSRAALMHHRLGEQDRALAAARLEVEQARTWGAPSVEGRALVALGRVTPGRRGTELLAEAVSVLERSTNAHELCRALYAYGSREGVDGRRAADALERARELSVVSGADRVTRQIREQIGRRPAVPEQRLELTPSEARVARLAAAGLHNADIARELQVSRRMIERYLTNAYRKLDISGRHALPPDIGAE